MHCSLLPTRRTLHPCCPRNRVMILPGRNVVTTSENPLPREVPTKHFPCTRVYRGRRDPAPDVSDNAKRVYV
jgi:hypothetical protein